MRTDCRRLTIQTAHAGRCLGCIRIPTFNVVNAFDNTSGDYELQDVGLDGLPDAEEQGFFSEWLSDIADWVTPDAYADIVVTRLQIISGTSGTEAQANEETILQRYERFNGYENNSNTGSPNGYPSPRPSPTWRT